MVGKIRILYANDFSSYNDNSFFDLYFLYRLHFFSVPLTGGTFLCPFQSRNTLLFSPCKSTKRMITDNITKQAFIVQILRRDIQNIYKAQLAIANENIYVTGKSLKPLRRRGPVTGVRSGQLLASLYNPDFNMQAQGTKFVVSVNIVKQLRFIDMKRFGNRRIYNRQVWGILYNNALKDIKYKFGETLRDSVGDALKEALLYKKS